MLIIIKFFFKERENHAHLLIEIIDIKREIAELNRALSELHVKLVEVDIPQYEMPQLLLQHELAQLLDGPLWEQRLRRLGKIPREHLCWISEFRDSMARVKIRVLGIGELGQSSSSSSLLSIERKPPSSKTERKSGGMFLFA